MDRSERIKVYKRLQNELDDYEMSYVSEICDEHDAQFYALHKKEIELFDLRAENKRLTAALILLKQYAEPTPGGYIINAAPMSIIDKALGDES